jgi:hypothetical protein
LPKPLGTPEDIIAGLHAAIVETLADPSVRQRLTDFIKAANIKAE